MYYLCENDYKPVTVQYYIAECITWLPRLTLFDLMNKLDLWMCFQNGTCLYVEDALCVCVCVRMYVHACACTWPKSSFIFFCRMLWKNPNDPFGQPCTHTHTHTHMHSHMQACMHACIHLSSSPSTPEITACESKKGWSALFDFFKLSSQAPLTTLLSPVKRN